ncbi:MAG: METTL5 family protein [Thermoplasmata archaeon]|nr:METTL5 family protein [Thermoplasmata archaeon]
MRRADLVRTLSRLKGFETPVPSLEQVSTPPEAALDLFEAALARRDLDGRTVLDLGSGTGVLSIGASLLGAREVTGVEVDPRAVAVAEENARSAGAHVRFLVSDVADAAVVAETVVMNPPFGAQRRHADRPFWDRVAVIAPRALYAFALADSRTFIERWAVAHGVSIDLTRTVRWEFPRTFPHHRKVRVELPVDLWVLRRESTP